MEYLAYFLPPFLSTVTKTHGTQIDMTPDEIALYLDAGVFKKVPRTYLKLALRLHLFFTPMRPKQTKRLITHTIDINNAAMSPPTEFDPVEQRLLDGTAADRCGWVADLMSWYHQLETPIESEPFYSFDTASHGALCLATLATGQRQTVGFAQTISKFLARKTSAYLHLVCPFARPSLHCEYIDNFRRREQDRATAILSAKIFLRVAAFYGVTVNETFKELEASVGLPYDFLGVHYDGTTVSLSEKMREKLELLLDECWQSIPDWTMHDLESAFGLLVSANSVVALCPAVYYLMYKFMRRRAQQNCAGPDKVNLWPCVMPVLRQWLRDMLLAPPRNMAAPPATPSCILVTDASLEGFGAILYLAGKSFSVGGAWPPWVVELDLIIAELEAKTVLLATLFFRQQFPFLADFEWDIVVDNTTVKQIVIKGRSPHFFLNEAVLFLREVGVYIRAIGYINTADNPADVFTRPFADGRNQLPSVW